jgi:SAM-dependent methyltransferase
MLLNVFRGKPNAANPKGREDFLKWYRSATLGRILREIEVSFLRNSLQLTYKQRILQVGWLGCEERYIPEEFRQQLLVLSLNGDGMAPLRTGVKAAPGNLPIASESIDLLILPHVLEFEGDPHQVLREVERVLRPEGQLVVLTFNPFSFHDMVRRLSRGTPFRRQGFIPPARLLDWLRLLKFEAEYAAAFNAASGEIIESPESLLRRSQAFLSLAYATKGIKRTYTVIPIEPAWIRPPAILAGQGAEMSISQDKPLS